MIQDFSVLIAPLDRMSGHGHKKRSKAVQCIQNGDIDSLFNNISRGNGAAWHLNFRRAALKPSVAKLSSSK